MEIDFQEAVSTSVIDRLFKLLVSLGYSKNRVFFRKQPKTMHLVIQFENY